LLAVSIILNDEAELLIKWMTFQLPCLLLLYSYTANYHRGFLFHKITVVKMYFQTITWFSPPTHIFARNEFQQKNPLHHHYCQPTILISFITAMNFHRPNICIQTSKSTGLKVELLMAVFPT